MKKLYQNKTVKLNGIFRNIAIVFCLGLLNSTQAQIAWTLQGTSIAGTADNMGFNGDRTGSSVSLSDDGMTMAVGSPNHTFTGTSDLGGKASVYSWNGTAWVPKGSPLFAESIGDFFGAEVSLNANGTCLAVGSYGNATGGSNAGSVRVFTFSGSAWSQLGATTYGTAANQELGKSVSISADGNTVAVGVPGATNSGGTQSGEIRMYSWNGSLWALKGTAIFGEATDDNFGKKVSISTDGNRVVASSPNHDNPFSNAGSVRVYSWDGSVWYQVGNSRTGSTENEYFGTSLEISSNINTMAVASPFFVNSGSLIGVAFVYNFDGFNWVQKGAAIVGVGDENLGNALAISRTGDTIALGAKNYFEGANYNIGKVKIFRWNGSISSWVALGTELKGSRADDNFGTAVSLSANGKTLAVGAIGNDGLANDGGRVAVYNLSCAGVTNITNQPASQTVCGSNLATIGVTATGGSFTYFWSNAATTQTIQAAAGIYTVTVTGACGTAISNKATVTGLPNTQITLQPQSQTICGSNVVTLSVAGTGSNITYLWSNGATTSTIQPTTAGTYLANVSGTCGLESSSSVQVTTGTLPSITGISQGTAVLPGFTTASLSVTATGSNLQYLWSNGATTRTITGVGAGEYVVTITGACGSVVSESVRVGNVTLAPTNSGYNYVTNFGSGGSANNQYMTISIGVDGRIYVADFESNRISVWNRSGNTYTKLTTFGGSGNANNQLNRPTSIHISADGLIIYVSDRYNNRVSVWSKLGNDYTPVTTFGSLGSGSNQFNNLHHITTSADGNKIFIADNLNHRIGVWTKSGSIYTPFTTFGSMGSETSQFSFPTGVAIGKDGIVFVADSENHRISVWTPSGNTYIPLTTFGSQGTDANQFSSPYQIKISSDDKIYVTESLNNRISVWTQSGNNFGNLTSFGSFGSGDKNFNFPSDVAFKNNEIYVSDYSNNRVSVWKTPAPIFYLQVTFDITAPTTFTGNTATLTWPTVNGLGLIAVTYCIRISKDRTMGSGVKTVCGLTGNSYKYNPNDPNGRTEAGLEEYFWQVAGVDAEGNYSQWSEVQQFSLDATATSTNLPIYQPTNLSIYPNPSTNGEFRMENGESVTITDVVGKEILSTTKSTFTIASKGIFIARVKSKSGITTLKLVVE